MIKLIVSVILLFGLIMSLAIGYGLSQISGDRAIRAIDYVTVGATTVLVIYILYNIWR